ncbi:hypothetical protein RRF57_001609 [Xylaria bambusicola]|uniref:Uncharacterized protein n=1 Tax=Xylaria bambusicola TaxID=326684 RepID=A0AAN7UCT9_9PEZI
MLARATLACLERAEKKVSWEGHSVGKRRETSRDEGLGRDHHEVVMKCWPLLWDAMGRHGALRGLRDRGQDS